MIQVFEDGSYECTGSGIYLHRLLSLKYMLKLECLGMTRHGRSAYSIIKEEFDLKGNKKKVFSQFSEMIEELKTQSKILD